MRKKEMGWSEKRRHDQLMIEESDEFLHTFVP
jgi:hypothetical protein